MQCRTKSDLIVQPIILRNRSDIQESTWRRYDHFNRLEHIQLEPLPGPTTRLNLAFSAGRLTQSYNVKLAYVARLRDALSFRLAHGLTIERECHAGDTRIYRSDR